MRFCMSWRVLALMGFIVSALSTGVVAAQPPQCGHPSLGPSFEFHIYWGSEPDVEPWSCYYCPCNAPTPVTTVKLPLVQAIERYGDKFLLPAPEAVISIFPGVDPSTLTVEVQEGKGAVLYIPGILELRETFFEGEPWTPGLWAIRVPKEWIESDYVPRKLRTIECVATIVGGRPALLISLRRWILRMSTGTIAIGIWAADESVTAEQLVALARALE